MCLLFHGMYLISYCSYFGGIFLSANQKVSLRGYCSSEKIIPQSSIHFLYTFYSSYPSSHSSRCLANVIYKLIMAYRVEKLSKRPLVSSDLLDFCQGSGKTLWVKSSKNHLYKPVCYLYIGTYSIRSMKTEYYNTNWVK